MKRFKLSDLQARAILDMPLRRLAALERKKIDQEHKEMLARIAELESLLASEKRMRAHIADELHHLKAEFGDRRRTQIVDAARGRRSTGPLTAGEALEEKDTWVAVTPGGLISRTPTARMPRLTGKDAPSILVSARTSDALYLFTGDGHCGARAGPSNSRKVTIHPAAAPPVGPRRCLRACALWRPWSCRPKSPRPARDPC